MALDIESRLKEAVRRRDLVADNVKRIEGRLEAARQSLSEAESECRARNIDPDNIDDHLARLETKFQDLVIELENGVAAAEQAIGPYLKEIGS